MEVLEYVTRCIKTNKLQKKQKISFRTTLHDKHIFTNSNDYLVEL